VTPRQQNRKEASIVAALPCPVCGAVAGAECTAVTAQATDWRGEARRRPDLLRVHGERRRAFEAMAEREIARLCGPMLCPHGKPVSDDCADCTREANEL
jgi:hypothetical protein